MLKALQWLLFDNEDIQLSPTASTPGSGKHERKSAFLLEKGDLERDIPSNRSPKLPEVTRWGIVGTSGYAYELSQCLKATPNCQLVAVAPINGQEALPASWGDNGEVRVYRLFLDMLRNPEVDVIYVATSQEHRANHCVLALEHDKHVVCEPPMGINVAEVIDMVDCAGLRRLLLMEALPLPFSPVFAKASELLRADVIGDVKMAHVECGTEFFNSLCHLRGKREASDAPRAQTIRVSMWWAVGGANYEGFGNSNTPWGVRTEGQNGMGATEPRDDVGLIQMGMSAFSLTGLAFGAVVSPNNIQAVGELTENSRSARQVSMVMKQGTGQLATVSCSTVTELSGEARIYGTKGSILISRPFWHPRQLTLVKTNSSGSSSTKTFHFPAPDSDPPPTLLPTPPSRTSPSDLPPPPEVPCTTGTPNPPTETATLPTPLLSPTPSESPRARGGGSPRVWGQSLRNDVVAAAMVRRGGRLSLSLDSLPDPISLGLGEASTPVMTWGGTRGTGPGRPKVVTERVIPLGSDALLAGAELANGTRDLHVAAADVVPAEEPVEASEEAAVRAVGGGGAGGQMVSSGLQYVVQEVHNCMRNRCVQSSAMSHEHSLRIAQMIAGLRSQLGIPHAMQSSIYTRIPSLSDWGNLGESPPTSPEKPVSVMKSRIGIEIKPAAETVTLAD